MGFEKHTQESFGETLNDGEQLIDPMGDVEAPKRITEENAAKIFGMVPKEIQEFLQDGGELLAE